MPKHKSYQRRARPAPSTVRVVPPSHPSVGGTRGYSMEMRQLALRNRQQGQENNPVFNQLRAESNYPSQETTRRWSVREQGEGHYRPYAMNGNRPSVVLVGEMRFKLVMYRILFPKATAAELNCYLFNVTSLVRVVEARKHYNINPSRAGYNWQ